ncbi:endonuclease/exonuclease/phosphatase family protein [Dactylosporangium matsuzakiense]|uniref:Endonuclease/exonuclease/phosphatase n=1 Tax=Dactylosporangium matsuzakiense TaxID=53360 RepID=A0A9W6KN96_9ACTN|nr:endonuclease/exonuclease/phosphatase family protein [Dactylosporangium matsuzakiense]UWZ44850.1 endonuclease/exonuclease/phosphatase family protein [Dactylosporangium matsuzakiense]GLL03679.1 endonuclease/exonuclease/phosphatase [Dactylosporangium matsuzakiense]
MRLATFNLMHGRSITDGLVETGRIGAAMAALDADVLGLQEVDRAQPRSGHADLTRIAADALGAEHAMFVPAVVGTPGEAFRAATDADADGVDPHYGVALISRYPVLEWRITRLPAAPLRAPILIPGPERMRMMLLDDEPRVLLAAVVATPIGRVTIATTHLSFVPGWNIRQLHLVRRALRTLPAPRILLADLNLPGGLPRLFSGWHRLAGVPTYPSPAPQIQFDHVLADRRGFDRLPRVVEVASPRMPFSDHRPLVVTLRSRPGTLPLA